MGKIRVRVGVDDNGVPKDIRKAINRGSRKAAKKLAKRLREEAQEEIIRKDASDSYGIWEGDLVGGFKTKSDGDTARVWNDDEAAGPMETGVAPGAFGARGPPIDNLLPWVRDHFTPDTEFDPWEIGGGENFVLPGDYDGYDKHHGATSGTGKRFATPEGDRTQASADAISGESGGSGGITRRSPDDIKPGESFFARSNRAWDYAEFEKFDEYDEYFIDVYGRRYHPDDFGGFAPDDLDPDDPDLSNLKKGDTVEWVFGDDTYTGVVSDPLHGDDHIEVDYDDDLHFIERELVVDWEPKPLPNFVEDSWFKINEDDPFDIRRTFYGQRVAVWDVNHGEYREATVDDFKYDRVHVTFTGLNGGSGWIYANQRRNNRLVAGERWKNLSRGEQMQSIEDYWDNRITQRANLTQARLDWAKDYYFNEMFPRSKDLTLEKDTLLMLGSIKAVQNPIERNASGRAVAFRLGSIEPKDYGQWDLAILEESDLKQVKSEITKTLKPYKDTLSHEFAHAVLHSRQYEMGPRAYSAGTETAFGRKAAEYIVIEDYDFGRSGLQQEASAKVPHAAQMVFGDASSGSRGAPIGFTRWNEYTYDEIHGGAGNFPGWETSSAGTTDRLVEAVNRAWWKQTVWAQEEYRSSGSRIPENHLRFMERAYSVKYGHETISTITQLLMTDDPTHSSYKFEARLRSLDQHYPWLLEEWLEHWEPIPEAANILRGLGYNV
ncbi:hypothetical protein HTZ84_09535 [Haloterrigena sp. SYSU A558-1]|uniref:Uncharacterized protein n=1 Tax=Haloterrigena gelatinilytica TaxID=2741724 RepID=A0ABX2L8J8_9EURY|nr:hypothetical protein [Haloterrigena gelatinilytica]NUC72547.1 hypothetical protein [Haloterrigena gelatinilytica]